MTNFGIEPLEGRRLLSVTWTHLGAEEARPVVAPTVVKRAAPATQAAVKASPAKVRRASPAARVTANVDTTGTSGSEMEPQIAVNPTNPNNLVMVAQNDVNGGDAITVSRSFDGGQNWSVMTWGAQDGFGSTPRPDARVAFDAYGNLYLAYMVAVSRSQVNIVVARSVDGGASFYASSSAVGSAGIDPDSPWITTGASSVKRSRKAVWLTFTDYTSKRVMIVGGASSGLGDFSGWGRPQRVSDAWGSYSNVSVGPKGQVAVAWQSGESGQGRNNIMFDVDGTGTGGGFGGDRSLFSTNVGGWDYIPAQANRSIDAEVKIAYDTSGGATTGRLYLAYTAENGNESNDTDVYFTYSDNNGRSWSKQVRVNDDSTRNSQFMPTLAVDQTTGVVGVAWLDARNSAANNTTQLFAAVSLDHGGSFQANVPVSFGTSNQAWANPSGNDLDYGDNGGLAFYAGRMIPVWADNSNAAGGNPDGGGSKFDVTAGIILVNP